MATEGDVSRRTAASLTDQIVPIASLPVEEVSVNLAPTETGQNLNRIPDRIPGRIPAVLPQSGHNISHTWPSRSFADLASVANEDADVRPSSSVAAESSQEFRFVPGSRNTETDDMSLYEDTINDI